MVVELLLPLALAFIMFSLGLTLVVGDFLRVFARPKAIALGLLGQIVLVPLLAYTFALGAHFSAEMAVGLMILAACPGGVSSGLLTHLARGETALSISLTAISSVAAVLTLPLVVGLTLQQFAFSSAPIDLPDLPVGRMVRGVFLLTTVPVLLGMGLRYLRPQWAAHIEKPAGKLATLLFVLIVIATFVGQREVLLVNLPTIGPAILALNIMIMSAGFGLVRAARLTQRDAIAVAMECGLQNAALGIFVAAGLLQRPDLAVPSVVYALLMNVGAIAFVFLMRRKSVP
jgi:BASS family bile acid:Na+ symporter